MGERWVKTGPARDVADFPFTSVPHSARKRFTRIVDVRVGPHRRRREVGHVTYLQVNKGGGGPADFAGAARPCRIPGEVGGTAR